MKLKELFNEFKNFLSKEERDILNEAIIYFTFEGIFVSIENRKYVDSIKEKTKFFNRIYIK